MKLKDFIQKLKMIDEYEGGDIEVVMADDIPVVEPSFSSDYRGRKVIITDQN